ncbi:MAG: HrpE/YscL family type III secretion apparatus protein [Chlamydiota bacterium]
MKFFSLIYQGELHTSEDEKIIPQEEYSILLSAEDVLKKAHEDAIRLKKETKEECEKLKEEARQKGFDQGLETFNEHILSFEKKIKKLHHEAYLQILPLALKAAKKIVSKELQMHPDTIVDIVLDALKPITQAQKVTIYVSKTDKELLETERQKIKDIFEQIKVLAIQERSDISPGGCIIETEAGIINATIENQWRALESAFERYKK